MKKITALVLLLALFASGCGVLAGPEPTPAPTATPEPTATPAPDKTEDMPFALTWGGDEYAGLYTGRLQNGRPEGQGAFEGLDAAGAALR